MNKLFIISCLSTSLVPSSIFSAQELDPYSPKGVLFNLASRAGTVFSNAASTLGAATMESGKSALSHAYNSVVPADRALRNKILSGEFKTLTREQQEREFFDAITQVITRFNYHQNACAIRAGDILQLSKLTEIPLDPFSKQKLKSSIAQAEVLVHLLKHIQNPEAYPLNAEQEDLLANCNEV